MMESIYSYLSALGYTHPLHPAFVHLPAGLTIGGFVFFLLGFLLRHTGLSRTAGHCMVLAFLSAIPTAVAGYLDWQHYYAGSLIFPIRMKLVLAGILLVLLAAVAAGSFRSGKPTFLRLLAHLLCFLIVVGLGYFGGELVYGKKFPAASSSQSDAGADAAGESGQSASVSAGRALFDTKCAFCHFAERTETKVGPGLKGLFERREMPASGRPVTAGSLRRQLRDPIREMPAFPDLTEDEIGQLTSFLKTL
jgi:uncharacterized membrane protein